MADHQELVDQFVTITSSSRHVAEHVLEAHAWDLDLSIDFYLDSGGVGHGQESIEHQPAPRSHPISTTIHDADDDDNDNVVLDDDNDDVHDVQVLASRLSTHHRRNTSRRHVEDVIHDEIIEDDWRPGHDDDDMDLDDDDDDDFDFDRNGNGRQSRQRAVRRNRPRGARQRDNHLDTTNRYERPNTTTLRATRQLNLNENVEHIDLPDDVDLEEQRMLLAAMTGEEYHGRVPAEFTHDARYIQRVLSPGAVARQQLRQEQDAAYNESLLLDKIKEEALERARAEAEAAALAKAEEEERMHREERKVKRALLKSLSEKEAALPEEPQAGADDSVVLVVRLPRGGRCSRRFNTADKLQSVFDFVDVSNKESGEVIPGSYNLVSQFPRRVFEEGGEKSLADAGLVSKQEALFIEMK